MCFRTNFVVVALTVLLSVTGAEAQMEQEVNPTWCACWVDIKETTYRIRENELREDTTLLPLVIRDGDEIYRIYNNLRVCKRNPPVKLANEEVVDDNGKYPELHPDMSEVTFATRTRGMECGDIENLVFTTVSLDRSGDGWREAGNRYTTTYLYGVQCEEQEGYPRRSCDENFDEHKTRSADAMR